jgi:Uncharacterized protein conserved in bacteria (DUF2252)
MDLRGKGSMSFRKDNDAFETWLGSQCDIVAKDVDYKHKRMKKSAFIFLRATYFRWAKKIGALCPELMDAPQVLSVGDLHLENFGTWRDADGRLVWGVNDFDEAAVMPYLLDLVRLAASARLAPDLAVNNRVIAETLLRGYREGLANPQPALLDEGETWLRPYAIGADTASAKFWDKVEDYPKANPPPSVVRALTKSLPKGAKIVRFTTRVAGGGSLGRPRYVVIADWRGGRVLREAKALVPSAWTWANGGKYRTSIPLELANGKYRAPDPFLDVAGKFIIRRIAADSHKIELGDDAGSKLRIDFLQAMAFDLASIHAAGVDRPASLRRDLNKRPHDWLYDAAKTAAAAVQRDYDDWRSRRK